MFSPFPIALSKRENSFDEMQNNESFDGDEDCMGCGFSVINFRRAAVVARWVNGCEMIVGWVVGGYVKVKKRKKVKE